MSLQKIYGRHAVLEALRSEHAQVEKVLMSKGGHGAILQELISAAQARNVELEFVDRKRFERLAGPVVHQGVMAQVKARAYADLEDVLQAATADLSQALVVVSDEIEDPRNLGAIARCAEGAGAHGLVLTSHHSAEITPVAEKASGGALEHLPVARVVNLARALEEMKAAGLWIAGLDGETGESVWDLDLNRPLALVVGNEGKGLRRLTLETCDMKIKIPMLGKVDSLNASVAAGIALFEIQRQRRARRMGA